jgi:signal peptidase II
MILKNPWFWTLAGLSLLGDRLTKLWIMQTLALHQSKPLWPGVFHFTYVTNSGAAFSLFSGNGEWLRWLSLMVSLGLMLLAWFDPKLDRWQQVGYGLILGGALGNGIDRFSSGQVVDFLDFRLIRFPIFNLADVAINLGVICLLVVFWQPVRRKRPPSEEHPDHL